MSWHPSHINFPKWRNVEFLLHRIHGVCMPHRPALFVLPCGGPDTRRHHPVHQEASHSVQGERPCTASVYGIWHSCTSRCSSSIIVVGGGISQLMEAKIPWLYSWVFWMKDVRYRHGHGWKWLTSSNGWFPTEHDRIIPNPCVVGYPYFEPITT